MPLGVGAYIPENAVAYAPLWYLLASAIQVLFYPEERCQILKSIANLYLTVSVGVRPCAAGSS